VQKKKIEDWKQKGYLREEKSVNYSSIFPLMDCIIIHGGLGTTADALRAGVPVIVTGVLLMDQRFWGRRVHELGIGPEAVHINDFPNVCVDLVNKALRGEWNEGIKKHKHLFKGETEDGVKENVEIFGKFVEKLEYEKK